jgi:hypothetical protein
LRQMWCEGEWRRSSRCASGTCVEVYLAHTDAVMVRDAKMDGGPVLQFSTASWNSFVLSLKGGAFRPPHMH